MMTFTKSTLLTCGVLAIAVAAMPAAAAPQKSLTVAQVVAQAPKPLTPEEKKKLEERKKKTPRPVAKPHAPRPPAAPPHAPTVQRKPVASPHAPAVQRKPAPPKPPVVRVKPVTPPAAVQRKPVAPPTAVQRKPAPAPVVRDHKDRRDHRDDADRRPVAKPAPAVKPPAPPAAAATKPAAPAPSATAPKSAAPAGVRTPAPAVPAAAAPPPPTKAQSASQFIQRKGQKPTAGLDAVRKERRVTTEGNRTIIREGNRTIVRDGNRAVIRHNEADRLAVGARKVRVEHKNNEIISVILRAAGVSIVTTTDRNGRLLRRVRRDRNGRETVIIDNSFAGARRGNTFVDLAPPRYRQPRDRYIVDARRAGRDRIHRTLWAAPIDRLERRYTLEEVLYNDPLREYMPRVDLDINFVSGSWQVSPSQFDELSIIAEGLNRAIERNRREVFLIEGHTDAVGSKEDNLSLSDRRAEAVAVVLTEEFGVPPENLVTQGYGEQYLKVPTLGPSRENRRVAIRRITPLIDRTAGR